MLWIILIITGFLAGTFGSIIGLGGGIIVVPSLLYGGEHGLFPNITPQHAVGTSIIILIVTGLSSTLSYIKKGKVDYKSGLIFFIGSGPGSIIGAALNEGVSQGTFYCLFGGFMIFVSFLLMIRDKLKPIPAKKGFKRTVMNDEGETVTYSYQPVLAVIISFVVGMISGLFGIGGGSLMMPAMILLFGFPVSIAVATSMFMIFLSSVVGSSTHLYYGNIIWLYALALVPGAWFGAKFGTYIHSKMKDKTVVLSLLLVLMGFGVRFIYKGIFL
ncbi:sulfite exporter TauE/SafE family protein [Fictibacillus sp. Mic-4]|uniref:sulfite exporter TauE/SafE family protein n=1 Tax=Fictibacillus sp. Mic-4 TaxID=3132826 RepID=UPI003CED81DC